MLWTFGDTLMTVTGADGFNYRSATAGWSSPGSLQLDEALDATGAPFQLFPFTADEAAYNQAHGPTERYALWPGSVIEAPDGSGAWIFYQRLRIHPGTLNYEALDVGLARLSLGSTVAVRDPSPLFSVATPAYALARGRHGCCLGRRVASVRRHRLASRPCASPARSCRTSRRSLGFVQLAPRPVPRRVQWHILGRHPLAHVAASRGAVVPRAAALHDAGASVRERLCRQGASRAGSRPRKDHRRQLRPADGNLHRRRATGVGDLAVS
jgi:hypothetical protein